MIILLRILGKRDVGELSIFDLVIILLIANIASLGLDNKDFFYISMLCLVTLTFLQKVISIILLHVSSLRNIFEGSPRVMIFEGKIKIKNLKKERYTIDDLTSQLREKSFSSISDIYLAILETNGELSIFKDKIPLQVISCGIFNYETLNLLKIDKNKIINKLNTHNINYKNILSGDIYNNEFIYFYRTNKKEEDIIERRLLLK